MTRRWKPNDKPDEDRKTNARRISEAVATAHKLPTCGATGKRKYRHQTDAAKAVGEARKINGDRKPQSHYRCPHCRRWHLTSMSQEEFRNGLLPRSKG